MPIQNEKVREHTFLLPMLEDAYFPKHLVGKGQDLLRQLAECIEREAPEGEAAAREAIADDVEFILKAYGYDVDTEERPENYRVGSAEWYRAMERDGRLNAEGSSP